MRERYQIGIVGENVAVPEPVEAADFIDFEAVHPAGKLVVNIRFCPFCAKEIKGPRRIQD